MEEVLIAAKKEALVTVVKIAQKQGKKGDKGTWKEFLNFHDKQMGDKASDPARRTIDDLLAFFRTFSNEEDLRCFANMLRRLSKCKAVERLSESCAEPESPEQRLVRLTLQHPKYLVDYSFPSHHKEWTVTRIPKTSKAKNFSSMISVDCEMVLCEDGTEALVQVCVVDRNLEVKLNELVNPNKAVADYRTEITGLTAKDMEGVSCSLIDIQKSMKKLLRHGTILVGHGLSHDLQALKLDHSRVVDTSYIFKYLDLPPGRRPSLKNLCKTVLGYELREEGAPHNCLDDAKTAMKLVLAKLEHGFEEGLVSVEDVPESEMGKLLLHAIPADVPRKELHRVFPKDFTFELQPNLSTRKNVYSAFAVFKGPQEANEAFNSIESKIETDTKKRPQKQVTFELSTGLPASLYVRKMAQDIPNDKNKSSLKKRSFETENTDEGSKKQKTEGNQCEQHVKEIASLEEKLREKDIEIYRLQRIVTALTRKQGL